MGLHWRRTPQKSTCSPQAQVVLQGELDAVDDLWQLRHHGQHRDTDEVLQEKRGSMHGLILIIHLPSMWSISASSPPNIQILGLMAGSWAGGTIYKPQSHLNQACHHPHAHLGDGGVGEDGADVLRGQVSTGRHAESGEQEDDQCPPAGPVNHSTVVVTRHWGGREKKTGLDTLERLESYPRGWASHSLGPLTVTVADVDVVDVRVSFQGEEEADEVRGGEQEGHSVHQGPAGRGCSVPPGSGSETLGHPCTGWGCGAGSNPSGVAQRNQEMPPQ